MINPIKKLIEEAYERLDRVIAEGLALHGIEFDTDEELRLFVKENVKSIKCMSDKHTTLYVNFKPFLEYTIDLHGLRYVYIKKEETK